MIGSPCEGCRWHNTKWTRTSAFNNYGLGAGFFEYHTFSNERSWVHESNKRRINWMGSQQVTQTVYVARIPAWAFLTFHESAENLFKHVGGFTSLITLRERPLFTFYSHKENVKQCICFFSSCCSIIAASRQINLLWSSPLQNSNLSRADAGFTLRHSYLHYLSLYSFRNWRNRDKEETKHTSPVEGNQS